MEKEKAFVQVKAPRGSDSEFVDMQICQTNRVELNLPNVLKAVDDSLRDKSGQFEILDHRYSKLRLEFRDLYHQLEALRVEYRTAKTEIEAAEIVLSEYEYAVQESSPIASRFKFILNSYQNLVQECHEQINSAFGVTGTDDLRERVRTLINLVQATEERFNLASQRAESYGTELQESHKLLTMAGDNHDKMESLSQRILRITKGKRLHPSAAMKQLLAEQAQRSAADFEPDPVHDTLMPAGGWCFPQGAIE